MAQRPLGAGISHALKARGVDVIFGIPGVHNVEMYRGIEEAGITHVLARHEGGAAFMADGYARASGKPGVCYTITGPGVTNALTGLGQAYSDSVPVLAIASCLDETAATRGQLHQMRDQRLSALSACDWAEEPRSAGEAYSLIDRAFAEFRTARSRPKYMQVPIAMAGTMSPDAPTRAPHASLPQVSHTDLTRAIGAILSAQKPLFIFGGGAVGGADVVGDLLRMTGAAAFTTYAGRGIVPDGAALSFGSMLARPGSAAVCADADLIIAVGTELSEVDLWRDDLGHRCPMIRVDIDAEVLGGAKADDIPLLGDAGAFLRAMSIAIPARVDDREPCWDVAYVAAKRAEWRAEIDAERPGLLPVIEAVQAVMPDDATIYSDMTQFAYAAKEVWDMPGPGLWHHPCGFGTLGYALPAAIGGKLARGDAPVCAIAGDYGFQYTVQELGTAVELGGSLPIILWDNGKLKEIEEAMVRSQIAPNAVVARNPSFAVLAEAYGAGYVAPRSLADIGPALTQAFAADQPVIVHLQSDVLI
ncbi:MAG: thiamine pyrophosphate-binding protein [Pseudomonadota bacterium]